MRWFTREHYEDPDFDDWDALIADYWAYIGSIRDALPSDLKTLLSFDLHDAVPDSAEINLVKGIAHIRFRTADRTRFIDCRYGDADFGESKLRYLELAIEARVPQRDKSGAILGWRPIASVLHDELTALGDRFQHAFLIDPLGDFALTFRGFQLSTEAAPERELPERSGRFQLVNKWTED